MKKNRVAIAFIIIALIGVGWMSKISSGVSKVTDNKKYIQSAEENLSKKLYQKAIMDYESALEIDEDKATRTKLLDVYALSYEDETSTSSEYVQAMVDACDLYEDDHEYWERLLSFLVETGDYKEANKQRKKSIRAGVKSDKLAELRIDIQYYFEKGYQAYDKFFRSPQGYSTVYAYENWGVMGPNGEFAADLEYKYIGPWNQNQLAVYKTERGTRLIDKAGIVQAIYDIEALETKACDEECIPVKLEEGWKFIDYDGKYILSTYDDVSSFQNNVSAVKKGEKWELINKKGEKASENTFSDIKLYGNGDYCYEGVMIAKETDNYAIYNTIGEKSNEFTAKDMDVYLGDAIAYQDSTGKWGYVDREGNVKIEPKFENAKSFSGGLAAVCKDGKWGFINSEGILVIDYQFVDADYFTSDGICFVSELENQYITIELKF